MDSILGFLAHQLAPDHQSFGFGFALPELALISWLDWMEFRAAHTTPATAAFDKLRATYRERPSLVATRPHA